MSPVLLRMSPAQLARRLDATGSAGEGALSGPVYRSLARRIAEAVQDGRIPLDVTLPSERDLAAGLRMSRTTVAAAYDLLREHGWLVSHRGSGSRITLPGNGSADGQALVRPAVSAVGVFGFPKRDDAGQIDLTTASLPAAADELRIALDRAMAALPGYLTSDGYSPLGLPVLRSAVAERYTASGLPTTADQILITNGAQHATVLTVQELSNPGDRIVVESPSYPVALDAIRAARRLLLPIRLGHPAGGDSAWDMDLLDDVFRAGAPRLAYLIPDFQNPTGALMSEAERERLTRIASRTGTVLLIDESFRDVPFGADPVPPHVAATAEAGRVISLGSMSKPFWGGLRIGWIRTTPAMVARLAVPRSLGDMAGSVLDQLVATELLRDPDAALAVQRDRLRQGRDALLAALAEHLPEWTPTRPDGGTSLWVRLPSRVSSTDLVRRAQSAGVHLATGSRFSTDGTGDSFLRLPFTKPPDLLTEAVHRLAALGPATGTGSPTSASAFLI